MTDYVAEIRSRCSDEGMPDHMTRQVVAAALLFDDPELQLRTATMLIGAWKTDRMADVPAEHRHNRGGGGHE